MGELAFRFGRRRGGEVGVLVDGEEVEERDVRVAFPPVLCGEPSVVSIGLYVHCNHHDDDDGGGGDDGGGDDDDGDDGVMVVVTTEYESPDWSVEGSVTTTTGATQTPTILHVDRTGGGRMEVAVVGWAPGVFRARVNVYSLDASQIGLGERILSHVLHLSARILPHPSLQVDGVSWDSTSDSNSDSVWTASVPRRRLLISQSTPALSISNTGSIPLHSISLLLISPAHAPAADDLLYPMFGFTEFGSPQTTIDLLAPTSSHSLSLYHHQDPQSSFSASPSTPTPTPLLLPQTLEVRITSPTTSYREKFHLVLIAP